MQLVPKILIFILFLGSSQASEDRITWNKLNLLEKKMTKWAKTVSEKDMISIGKMKQRPEEVEFIRAFYPYLLPEKFLTYNVDMECFPAFHQFKMSKKSEDYQKWDECLENLYRKEPPRLLKKALKDLKP